MNGSVLADARAAAKSPSGSVEGRPVTAGGALSGEVEGAGMVATGGAPGVFDGSITCGPGVAAFAGFLPYSGALGSQSRFLRVSAASCSGVRLWPLLRKGIGTLVTYTATARAAAKPSTTPMMMPTRTLPR